MEKSTDKIISTKITTIICVSLIALTLLHYWYTLSIFLLNAPDSDDYIDVFWFLEIWLAADSLPEKINALFLPIHEHITVFSHIIYALHYAMFNEINFAHYILIGQIILLSICFTLASVFANKLSWPISLAIAICFYFNLGYWHSSFWAMTSLSNQAVILFALLSARSFYLNPDKTAAPLLFAIASCFSQSNGLAILIALFFAKILYKKPTQVCINQSTFLIAALFVSILAVHFIHQNPFNPIHHLDHQAFTTEPELIHLYQRDISNTGSLTPSVWRAVPSFFIVGGATALKTEQFVLAGIIGLIILSFWIYVLVTRKAVNSFVAMSLLFICISIFLIAIGRGSFSIELAPMQSRYRMYSFLLLILSTYQLISITNQKKLIIYCCLCFAIFLQILGRQHIDAMIANHNMLVSSYYNWLVDGGFGRTTMPIYPPNQDRRLKIALKNNRYNPISAIPHSNLPVKIISNKTQDSRCHTWENNAPITGSIQAFSKKPTAKASELTLQIDSTQWQAEQNFDLLICGANNSVLLTLNSQNLNAETNQYWPILIEKKVLPRGHYAAYSSQEFTHGMLGQIFIK